MSRHGSLQNLAFPFFAMAEVAMAVPNKQYFYRKTANINRAYIQVLWTHTSKTAKIGTVNLVAEHVVVVTMCSTTKFTVPILAVFDV